MTNAKNRKKGIQWGLCDKLEDLDFPDDICILAPQSFEEVEARLNNRKVEAQNVGMKINSQTTEGMSVNPKSKDTIISWRS